MVVRNASSMGPNHAQRSMVKGKRTMFFWYSSPMTSSPWMKGAVGAEGLYMSKFALFVMLKIVVCIGSDCIENVFRMVGLGCRRWAGDVDVCPNADGGVWAVVASGGIRREQNVKWLCCGIEAEMEQWFDCHGCVRI